MLYQSMKYLLVFLFVTDFRNLQTITGLVITASTNSKSVSESVSDGSGSVKQRLNRNNGLIFPLRYFPLPFTRQLSSSSTTSRVDFDRRITPSVPSLLPDVKLPTTQHP